MNSKERLLNLMQLLYTQTDEEHPMTTAEIVDYFSQRGEVIHRQTVKAEIDLLCDFGMDIIAEKGTQTKFYCATRQLDIPELKLLIDAVESSKFITAKKSKQLVDKLSSFASVHQANELKRRLYTAGRIKPENESIYYIVDLLHKAIYEQKKITFRYYEYTIDKAKVFKHNGQIYSFSPYALFWNEDRYYIIGFSDIHNKIVKFRVDRMELPKISEQQAAPIPEDFDASEYAVKIFDMYDGAETTVELLCDNDLIKVIIDRFGENVQIKRLDSSHFTAVVNVSASPTFYGWVFQFSGKMKILSPQETVSEYYKMLNAAK